MPDSTSYKPDWLSRLLTVTMQGPLPLLLLLTALAGGIVALMITPREEEPQIIVPMADVLVTAPGLSAEQVEHDLQSIKNTNRLTVTGGRPRQIRVELDPTALANLHVKGRPGITKIREKSGLRDAPPPMVPLAELGRIQYATRDKVIHHKNLRRVVYVFADIAGRPPAEIVLDVTSDMNREPADGQPTALEGRTYLNPGGRPGVDPA